MSKLDNVRISLKIDDLSNWNNSNITLNNGEVALIRLPNNQVKIKIGDGSSQINDLNYLNEQEFFTSKLSAYNVEFGLKNYAQQFSVAEGQNVSAYGTYQHAAGYNVEAISNETFAFVWNGKDLYGYDNRYKSHGPGSFSINPLSGLSGFYIGEKHLADILYNSISNEIEPLKNNVNQNIATLNTNIGSITQATNSLATNFSIVDGKVNELSQDIENKILIDGEKVDQFEVKHISRDDYYDLVNSEDGALSNAIYIVSSDTLNMYGEQIKNVADGTDLSDAVNLNQLCTVVQSIEIPEIPTKISELENDLSLAKIKTNNQYIEELEIKHISRDEYYRLILKNSLLSNAIYVLSGGNLNAYNKKIENVANGEKDNDAVNLSQVNEIFKNCYKNIKNITDTEYFDLYKNNNLETDTVYNIIPDVSQIDISDSMQAKFNNACENFRSVCYEIREALNNETFKGGYDEILELQNSDIINTVRGVILLSKWSAANSLCTHLASTKLKISNWFDYCWKE